MLLITFGNKSLVVYGRLVVDYNSANNRTVTFSVICCLLHLEIKVCLELQVEICKVYFTVFGFPTTKLLYSFVFWKCKFKHTWFTAQLIDKSFKRLVTVAATCKVMEIL